jgi:hypothetical protein
MSVTKEKYFYQYKCGDFMGKNPDDTYLSVDCQLKYNTDGFFDKTQP